MSMNRRTFLATAGSSLVLGRHLNALARAKSIKSIGVQLYTVRDEMTKNVDNTLAQIAAIGFKEVEFAGYFNRSPQEIRDLLRRHDLAAPSAHVGYADLTDKWQGIVDGAHTIGHKFLVNAYLDDEVRKQPDIYKRAAAAFNRAGEISKKAGIQFAYHNHHFEFVPVDGKLPYEILLEECDAGLVKMEMDLCWISVAGQDPVAYFQKYPGRFPMVHVKGLKKFPPAPAPGAGPLPFDVVKPDITEVGTNDVIDWKRIFAQSNQAGIKHYFVEHDQPAAAFDSIKSSYEYLQKLQF